MIDEGYENSGEVQKDSSEINKPLISKNDIKMKEKETFHEKIPIVVIIPGLTGGSASNYIK